MNPLFDARLSAEEKDRPGPQGDLAVKDRPVLKEPPMYKVLLHNDDYTTMEFVVWVLREVFHRSEADAVRTMLLVHRTGTGVAGVFTREVAETKVRKVHRLARQAEYPLRCTFEEA